MKLLLDARAPVNGFVKDSTALHAAAAAGVAATCARLLAARADPVALTPS